jgi:hypothetical protein
MPQRSRLATYACFDWRPAEVMTQRLEVAIAPHGLRELARLHVTQTEL